MSFSAWNAFAPHRAPGRSQRPGEAGDRGVLAAQLTDRPPAGAERQQRPRPGVTARRDVALVDAPCFGRPVTLVWRERLWRCPGPGVPGRGGHRTAGRPVLASTPHVVQPIGAGVDSTVTRSRPSDSVTSTTRNPSRPTSRSQRSQYRGSEHEPAAARAAGSDTSTPVRSDAGSLPHGGPRLIPTPRSARRVARTHLKHEEPVWLPPVNRPPPARHPHHGLSGRCCVTANRCHRRTRHRRPE